MKKNKTPQTQEDRITLKKFARFAFGRTMGIEWAIIAVCLCALMAAVRHYFPMPLTLSDSGAYELAAMEGRFNYLHPYGYSAFLRFVHFFSSDQNAIVVLQFLFYGLALGLLAATVKRMFPPLNKWLWYGMVVFLALSPVCVGLTNTVLSDTPFAVLFYLMVIGLLFFLWQGSVGGMLLAILALLGALHTRYSAMVFPPLFIIFFLVFSRGWKRWAAVGLTILAFMQFHSQTKQNMRVTTGIDEFGNGFSGWQFANNAIFAVPFTDLKPEALPTRQMQELHAYLLMNKEFILKEVVKDGKEVNVINMWSPNSLLKQVLYYNMQASGQPYVTTWIRLGNGLFADYGKYVITHYPGAFMRHYYIVNAKQVFYPTKYDVLVNWGPNVNKVWFDHYPELQQSTKHATDQFTGFLSACTLGIWVVIGMLGALAIVYRRRMEWSREERAAFWVLFAIGVLYYSSTVFASPVEVRYWMPMRGIQFACIYLIANQIFRKGFFFKRSE